MFYQFFLSQQEKQCMIITFKHGIYELPHDMPNNLKKLGNITKFLELHKIVAQCAVSLPKLKFC